MIASEISCASTQGVDQDPLLVSYLTQSGSFWSHPVFYAKCNLRIQLFNY